MRIHFLKPFKKRSTSPVRERGKFDFDHQILRFLPSSRPDNLPEEIQSDLYLLFL